MTEHYAESGLTDLAEIVGVYTATTTTTTHDQEQK